MTLPKPPDVSNHHDVLVVGAGLAGLAAATQLHQAGRSVVVLERSDGPGGRVRTDMVEGFLLDRGFQVLLTSYPELHRQIDVDALGLAAFEPGALVHLPRNNRFVVVGDPLRRPRTTMSTATAPIGSPLDKLRILSLRRRVTRGHAALLLKGEDRTTIEMLRAAGFSTRIIERFFRPLFAGIQLDPSLQTSQRMFDVIFRALSTGDATLPAQGMQAIPDQLAARLPEGTLRYGTNVLAIEGTTAVTDRGERITASTVVVAVEGPAANRLLGTRPVGSRPVSCVYFAADNAPTRHRLVILDAEHSGPAANVCVPSNVAPTYAPPGRHLVSCAVPGRIDANIEHDVRAQLRSWWGPVVDSWKHLRTYRIEHGQPDQSPPLSPKRSVALGGGRFVCGDHRDTGSIQGALYSGRRCAEAVIGHLAASST